MTDLTLSVPDMSCGHCKAAVEEAVAGVDAGATVAVDLDTRTARVASSAPVAALLEALEKAGYKAEPA